MDNMLHGQLHYRCAIDLKSLYNGRDNWGDLIKRIRSWVARVAQADSRQLAHPWFYRGGRWQKGCPKGIRLETCQIQLEPDSETPDHWACCFEHPCGEYSQCLWRTDITLTTVSPEEFRLILINQRSVRPTYIGEEPPAPSPSVPNLIRRLLKEESWRCMAGEETLSAEPITARVGYIDLLKKELENTGRACPIVYVTRDFESGEPLVDVQDLARDLAGTAVVYVAENSEADKETEAIFERDFRCWGGMVRVYQPKVRFCAPRDARRHRFFEPGTIATLGQKELKMQIVRACCRRAYLLRSDDVASIDEVRARYRMQRLRQLADERRDDESEFMELVQSVQADNDLYKERIEVLRQESQEKSGDIEELSDKLRSLQHEYDAYKQSTQEIYSQHDAFQARLQAIDDLKSLPESLRDVLEIICRLHSGRIVVLDEALKSADSANFDTRCLGAAWRCLWSIATDLHDLCFQDGTPRNLEKAYKDKTGFDLALNEGTETRKRKSLTRLRKRNYNGQDIDITPHVKWGNAPPKCLRVHFAIDQKAKTLVIGHCGDHLENYTSQSRK